jgi:hypothetical protein
MRQNVESHLIADRIGLAVGACRAHHEIDVTDRSKPWQQAEDPQRSRLKHELMDRTEQDAARRREVEKAARLLERECQRLFDEDMAPCLHRLTRDGFVSHRWRTDVNDGGLSLGEYGAQLIGGNRRRIAGGQRLRGGQVAINHGPEMCASPHGRIRVPAAHQAGADNDYGQGV